MKLDKMFLIALLAFSYNANAALLGNDASNASQKFKESDECFSRLKSDNELAVLSDKVGLSNPDVTLVMLANDAKPTGPEIESIVKWAAKRDNCFSVKKESMNLYYPNDPRTALSIENYDQVNKLILKLYKGNISYGEFNVQRKDISTEFQKRISAFSTLSPSAVKTSQQDSCNTARTNMTQFCNQANNSLHPAGSSVTVNIDGNNAYSNTPVGHADIQAASQCGFWQAEVNKVCR